MKILEPGHYYEVETYDSRRDRQRLLFMKRVGEGYPGNKGEAHGGTNCQEVLRVLIDRTLYLNRQAPCAESAAIIQQLRTTLLLFEIRAARRHGRTLNLMFLPMIEALPTCETCGHIACAGH